MNAVTAIDTGGERVFAPDALCPVAAEPQVEVMALPCPDAAWAAAWDALAADAAEPDVFAERWFADASRHLLPPGVRQLAVRSNGQLIGLLPVIPATRYGRIPLRHTENWAHYHRFLGAPLLRRGHEAQAWRALLTALDADPAAGALLHVSGLVEGGPVHRGLIAAAHDLSRPCDTVHRIERAMLATDLSPDAYYAATVRKKKRKELGRLRSRLLEQGRVETRRLGPEDAVSDWIEDFLALERAGWKGAAGSALACTPETAAFFRDAVISAHAAGKLDIIRIDLDGTAIAMLVNLLAPPGAFSFKTAFDERLSRFSPGVLLQIDNLQLLARGDIAWMDSCAVENHPMINSLWGERRAIVRVSVPLAGAHRRALFTAARGLERAAAAVRALRTTRPVSALESDA
ncbi:MULTISPECIES: GNAT family N-acetyltransferase [unclassified Sphingomonas]|uniref:GNAT family N-acetyltransferase n=1 Tax=unclassified Sphingomonas TaxID=196159 RepID=UPI000AA86022|nr:MULTISPECIES: GNAT family N-acetyltransferase [unclassified Sphingomonas]